MTSHEIVIDGVVVAFWNEDEEGFTAITNQGFIFASYTFDGLVFQVTSSIKNRSANA